MIVTKDGFVYMQGSYTFSGQRFKYFSRTFQDPTLKFQGLFFIRIYLQPSKMFVLKAMFWALTHTHAEMPENQSLKTHANQMFAVH